MNSLSTNHVVKKLPEGEQLTREWELVARPEKIPKGMCTMFVNYRFKQYVMVTK
ncbi:hypothetical protein LINPERPRIM_LOCUS5221, partial [Linum perenne]